jgi:hypothetical protein
MALVGPARPFTMQLSASKLVRRVRELTIEQIEKFHRV